jgi:hypothetical protein
MTDLFAILSYLTKDADPNGLEVYFTVSDGRATKARNTTPLLASIKTRSQLGTTNISLGLSYILNDYRSRLHEQKRHRLFPRKVLKDVRPMSLYVLTDGIWEPPADASTPIRSLVKELQELGLQRTQVGIQFIRFGEDPEALERLQALDDKLDLPMYVPFKTHLASGSKC